MPYQPEPPETTFIAATDELMISWVAPDNGGSAITKYTIYIQTIDPTSYLTDLTYCDGSLEIVMSQLSCIIPTIVLH